MVFKPVYILILFATILVDFWAGILIERSEGRKRKMILIVSIVSNLGFLAFFKYTNFFLENINHFLQQGKEFALLEYILPIGLSFHTFQALSYTIEVYRKNQKAEQHLGYYALYVMFYPQLVAGPIERPQNVLPQFREEKSLNFDNIKLGLLRMSWGFFKKIVIADRLSLIVDPAFNQPENSNSISLILSAIAYSFEIYCDFSGYSDIALGSAKVMGFDLMENFKNPYSSTSISEFWQRWHISLSTWFRDYLYIPLGGNRVKPMQIYLNTMIVFGLSGLWHGAKWNFVIWGILHGLFIIIERLKDSLLTQFKITLKKSATLNILSTIFTFSLVTFAWIFFRATGFSKAKKIIAKILDLDLSQNLNTPINQIELLFCLLLIVSMLIFEKKDRFRKPISNLYFFVLAPFSIMFIYLFGVFLKVQFIYFQF